MFIKYEEQTWTAIHWLQSISMLFARFFNFIFVLKMHDCGILGISFIIFLFYLFFIFFVMDLWKVQLYYKNGKS